MSPLCDLHHINTDTPGPSRASKWAGAITWCFPPPHCLVSHDHFNCPSSELLCHCEGGPRGPVLFLISLGHHHRVLSSLAHPFLLSHTSSLISPSLLRTQARHSSCLQYPRHCCTVPLAVLIGEEKMRNLTYVKRVSPINL